MEFARSALETYVQSVCLPRVYARTSRFRREITTCSTCTPSKGNDNPNWPYHLRLCGDGTSPFVGYTCCKRYLVSGSQNISVYAPHGYTPDSFHVHTILLRHLSSRAGEQNFVYSAAPPYRMYYLPEDLARYIRPDTPLNGTSGRARNVTKHKYFPGALYDIRPHHRFETLALYRGVPGW